MEVVESACLKVETKLSLTVLVVVVGGGDGGGGG